MDRDAGVARLPSDLVERALDSCPREVLLAGATEADDVLLDGSAVHFLPSGTPTDVLDADTGQVRSGTAEDVRQAIIVVDAMPAVDVLWAPVGAVDVPDEEMAFAELLAAVEWSPKHFQHEVTAPWHVPAMTAICEELSGSLEAYRARPRLSYVCCTRSPLGVGHPMLDLNVAMARLGGPIVVYPMPIAGATAPVTVAGAVVMNVAEFLACATAIQLQAPGAPLVMGAGTSLLDMKSRDLQLRRRRDRAHVRRLRGGRARAGRAGAGSGSRDGRAVRRRPGRLREGAQGSRRGPERQRPDHRRSRAAARRRPLQPAAGGRSTARSRR